MWGVFSNPNNSKTTITLSPYAQSTSKCLIPKALFVSRIWNILHGLHGAVGRLLKYNTVGNEYIDMVNVPNISVHTLIFSTLRSCVPTYFWHFNRVAIFPRWKYKQRWLHASRATDFTCAVPAGVSSRNAPASHNVNLLHGSRSAFYSCELARFWKFVYQSTFFVFENLTLRNETHRSVSGKIWHKRAWMLKKRLSVTALYHNR